MAVIPLYENKAIPTQPGDGGTDALISAARRVGPLLEKSASAIGEGETMLAKSVSNIFQNREDLITTKEKSQALVQLARHQIEGTDLFMKDPLQDPNDFHSNVLAPAGEAIMNGLSTAEGRKWGQDMLAHTQAAMIRTAASENSAATGKMVVDSIQQAQNTYAGLVREHPEQLNSIINVFQNSVKSIASSTPGIKPQVQAQIVKGSTGEIGKIFRQAVEGTMDKNPDAGLALARNPQYSQYVSPEMRSHFESYYTTVTKGKIAEQRADEVTARRVEKEAFDQEWAGLSASMIDPTTGDIRVPPGFEKKVRDLSQMPGARQQPGAIETLINFRTKVLEDAAKGLRATTDPSVYRELAAKIGNPSFNELEAFRARAAGKLSDKDFTFFKEAANAGVRNPQLAADQHSFDKLFTAYKGYITDSTMMKSNPLGDQRAGEYYALKHKQFLAGLGSGVPADDMLNPVKPTFLFNDITRYAPTAKDQLEALKQKTLGLTPEQQREGVTGGIKPLTPIGGGAPAVVYKPGESAEEYLKRARGGGQ